MLRSLAQLTTLQVKANQIVDQVKANPVLLAMLIGVGVLTACLFLWGIFKQGLKATIVGGVLSAGAWYWYFNVR